jgi:protein TonB
VNYAQEQRNPGKHATGIGIVVLIHVAVVYALVTGLAKKVVEVIKQPLETKVIEEIKKPPPPPPDIVVPPPPVLAAPPPPFIPPPEVQIATPPPLQQPAITATPTAPPAVANMTPLAPPTSAPAQPAPVSAAVVCSNFAAVMGDAAFPKEAVRIGLEKGDALIQFTLGANGEIKDVKTVRASHPIFARNSIRLVGDYKCQAQGREVLVQVPFGYKLE